jgi:hypothetical protein
MATNWVLTEFCLIQESGGNILTEESDYIALQEFDSTVWTVTTEAGSG